jgi:ABC-type multidrug transport system fused ATPase/permease subunit
MPRQLEPAGHLLLRQASSSIAEPTRDLPNSVYGYIWRIGRRHQLLLSLLSVLVFAMSMAPLELQRRIVNEAYRGNTFDLVVILCAIYAGVALLMGALKLGVNVYRGYLSEAATRDLRRRTYALATGISSERGPVHAQGTELAVVISEVEPVGSFVGISISEPLLQCGILVSVLGYMLFLEPWMAMVCLAIYVPQLIFVPIMLRAINRRAKARIKVIRNVSAGLMENGLPQGDGEELPDDAFERRINDVFGLNMQIFKWKYALNFLMNALYHVGLVGVLLVGGWFVISGRTEIGTVVAFISGLTQVKDPWDDLINYFRESTAAQVKYRLITKALGGAPVPLPG